MSYDLLLGMFHGTFILQFQELLEKLGQKTHLLCLLYDSDIAICLRVGSGS